MLRAILAGLLLAGLAGAAVAAEGDDPAGMLRYMHGDWEVTTEFLNPDGSVASTVPGTYSLSWATEGRVLVGKNRSQDGTQTSGILFYLKKGDAELVMHTVGTDGHLWTLTGPVDGSGMMSEVTESRDGGTFRLRFTHFDREPDTFRSRMEYTTDDGATWVPGNRQSFRRVTGDE
jgi:hypothetical protein